jgi:Phosphotransferase enzyme family
MGKHEPVVLLDDLGDHPAVRAWRSLEPGGSPTSVEVLKPEKRKSAVFRLHGVGANGEAIIAKRRAGDGLDLERAFYLDVLPSLSLPTLDVHGFVEADEEQSWIFLEDAGETWYDPEDPEHLALAVRWLADLHTRSGEWTTRMPDTGPRYFRAVADVAIEGLAGALGHPALSAEDGEVLRAVASHVEAVVEGWDEIEAACEVAPLGVVHGDFVPKNVRIRERPGGGRELVAFDWETAGAASPAADVALLPEQGPSLREYHALVRATWPDLGRRDAQELARVGRLLRLLHAVQWELRSFRHAWIERALRNMRSYERHLREAIEGDAWRSR